MIPRILRDVDIYTYGKSLYYFIVHQLTVKDRDSLWNYLNYLASCLPNVVAVRLLEENRAQLAKLKMERLDELCQTMIQASEFPAAMSLYLAAFMQQCAHNDLSREEQFEDISNKYIEVSYLMYNITMVRILLSTFTSNIFIYLFVKIAQELLQQIESDHLLAIMVEIPCGIDDMSIFDIALRFKLTNFLDFHRFPPLMLQMWYRFEYLDPQTNFIQIDRSNFKTLRTLAFSPKYFYFSPVGQYLIQAFLYLFYVLYVSWIAYLQIYPYEPVPPQEWLLWLLNLGYVSFEVVQLMLEGRDYFNGLLNFWDIGICVVWIILAFIRFSVRIYHTQRTSHRSSLYERNSSNTTTYMFFFGVECVLLWTRVTSFFQRNPSTGALLTMIFKMFKDILVRTFFPLPPFFFTKKKKNLL
ncbi:potassium ion channel Yvc1 [Reticulomyxa filosa]|uniref:Potassium ion channel Yvc1 n=1 Tax=Reticulomyxa filosa TaxID=46433 RepID=X6N988_RETFI|nr:potassium ion channel Yvc1 [Reticulomyxa filosa]|eukprot:ETO22319.1 potassium ion channel Yvc1 [Reticulomyxa filosa]